MRSQVGGQNSGLRNDEELLALKEQLRETEVLAMIIERVLALAHVPKRV